MSVEQGNTEYDEAKGFFEAVLYEFSQIPPIRMNQAGGMDEPTLLQVVAKVGFTQFAAIESWTDQMAHMIREIVDRDLNAQALSRFDIAEAAVRAYVCFVYGVLMGLWASQQIDDNKYRSLASYLPVYYFAESEQIAAAYVKGIGSN